MNGGCKIHGPAALADQLGLGMPSHMGANGGCRGGMKTRHCPEVIRAFDGVRYIAENTRREEESVRVSITRRI